MVDLSPRGYHPILRPGISVGAVGCPGSGTLGMVLVAPGGRLVILSAWHVLVGAQGGKPLILQPGRADGASDPRLVVGRVIHSSRESPFGEVAVAEILRRRVSTRIHGTLRHFAAPRVPKVGEELVLRGRSSPGEVRALVKEVGGMESRYSKGSFQGVRLEPLPGSGSDLTRPGDSGAVWRSPEDGAAIALHLAGEAPGQPPHAVASLVGPLIRRWNLHVVKRP